MKQPCALCNWDDVETYTQWGVNPLPLFKNWAGSLERIQKTVDNFPVPSTQRRGDDKQRRGDDTHEEGFGGESS